MALVDLVNGERTPDTGHRRTGAALVLDVAWAIASKTGTRRPQWRKSCCNEAGPRLVLAGAALVTICGVLWGTSRPTRESSTRPAIAVDASAATRGAAAFEGAAFGGISMDALASNAVPWRLVAAALVLEGRARDPGVPLNTATLDRVLRRFGFLTGATIVNRAPGASPVIPSLPLGMTYGDLAPVGGSVIRAANLGCATCHAGVTYAADGRPLPDRAMLGTPNSSIDLEAYTMAIFRALRRFADSDQLLPAAAALYPEMGWRERTSLRLLVLPLARKRLGELAEADRPLPFPNGAPGSTNGVAALKAALGQPLIGGGPGDAGVVSIPDLADRVWRTSLQGQIVSVDEQIGPRIVGAEESDGAAGAERNRLQPRHTDIVYDHPAFEHQRFEAGDVRGPVIDLAAQLQSVISVVPSDIAAPHTGASTRTTSSPSPMLTLPYRADVVTKRSLPAPRFTLPEIRPLLLTASAKAEP
jgi:hypothetical protein